MTRIAFVTDSTAYLTEEQQRTYDIHVVPLSVVLDGQSYREGLDLTHSEYYQRLSSTKGFPTTSQPSLGDFTTLFEHLLQSHDTVLGLLLSSELSGTYHTAAQAAAMVGGDIRLIDSRITSYGIAGPLLEGVELARQGKTADDILQLWQAELATVQPYFVVDTLEMLHRGGRIGGAAAVFGSLLQIKPILTVRDGKIELFEKIRTHRRAMERILNLLDEALQTGKQWRVAVVHADCEGDALALQAKLRETYPGLAVTVSALGPVVGTHSGPGTLALVYYESFAGNTAAAMHT